MVRIKPFLDLGLDPKMGLGSFFHPFVGIAVAVEDNALVFLHDLLQQVLQFFVELVGRNALQLVGDEVEGFGYLEDFRPRIEKMLKISEECGWGFPDTLYDFYYQYQ